MRRRLAVGVALVALFASGCTSWVIDLEGLPAQPTFDEVRSRYADPLRDYLASLRVLATDLAPNAESREPAAGDPAMPAVRTAARELALAYLRRTEATFAALHSSPTPVKLLEDLKNARVELRKRTEGGFSTAPRPKARALAEFKRVFRDEDDANWAPVGNVLLEEAQEWLDRRADLFSRKYFHDPTDEGGNILEAYLNSKWIFRSARLAEDRHPDSAGVSPWEATARLEPVAAVEDANRLGVMGAIGVTYHLFPSGDGGTWDTISDWVQRTGVRVGVGYLEQSGETGNLALGGALQLRSLTVWGLYDAEESDFFVAIGAGDFRWLGELTTWFD